MTEATMTDAIGQRTTGDAGVAMRWIDAGPFEMGSDAGGPTEGPVRTVHVSAFEIDVTPVTNEQFARFVAATGHVTTAEHAGAAWAFVDGNFREVRGTCWRSAAVAGRATHPVVYVTHDDAAAFASWAGKRLPTEAEWEKAARGGLRSALYPWGDAKVDGNQCNFARVPSDPPPTTDVGRFAPNGYGLLDMVGNVWQWCADWHDAVSYPRTDASALRDPTGPDRGETRVRRGGSWNVVQPFRLRCANRGAYRPHMAAPNIGFRCVRGR